MPAKIDVRSIRMCLDMTEDAFAGRFGFGVNALRHWDQDSPQREGATRAYLPGIERTPDPVRKAFRDA